MPVPEPTWQDDLDALLAARDEVVVNAGSRLAGVFHRATLRPPARDAAAREAVVTAVRASFPLQFAQGFARWRESAARLEQAIGTTAAPEAPDERVSGPFAHAAADLMELWRRLVSFLPFIFMTTVNRLDPDVVRRRGASELTAALRHYEAFYYVRRDEQHESDQRELLEALLRLFRRLDRVRVLGGAFVLAPLVAATGGFARLMPERFEAHLLLIQQIRNLVQHHALAQRAPGVLAALGRLLEAVFLDVVGILRPICEAYQLVYVSALRIEPTGPVADGIAFSGLAAPRPLAFRLAGPRADAEKIEAGQLYLIRRGAEQEPTLVPTEYLNLTPFLIYEVGSAAPAAADPARPERRALFVFREFRERELAAVFNEFAGGGLFTVSARAEQRLASLIDEIRAFRLDVGRLVEGAAADLPAGGDRHALLFARTWQISREHLATVMDPARYDPAGRLTAEAPAGEARPGFVEELFVAPAEDGVLAEFRASGRRGLVLTGPSGAGKSNLLCAWFLATRRSGHPAVFLAGRFASTPVFAEFLAAHVLKRVDPTWKWGDLDAVAGEDAAGILVLVDAVNEFTGEGGALAFLTDLVRFLQDGCPLPRARFVVTCREETWSQYVEAMGRAAPLDPAVFHGGDARRLSALDDEDRRRRLYAAYQQYFDLRPPRYERLSAAVKSLIRFPLMMGVIAETYSNRPGPGAATIPRDLDYFTVFRRLTERKLADAARLVAPTDPRREAFPALVEECLFTFARLVYQRIAGAEPAAAGQGAGEGPAGGGDTVPWDRLLKDPDFQPFIAAPSAGSVSPFMAALQVGLLERSFVTEVGYFGNQRTGRVCRFFHDEYTQHWLGAVYNAQVLGRATPDRLADPVRQDELVRAMRRLIELSLRVPILDGALDHWLHANLTLPPAGSADLLLPVLDRLAASESGAERYVLRSFLSQLLCRGIVAPEALFPIVLRAGGPGLAGEAAELFLEAWRDVEPSALRACLDATGPPHEARVIARLADVFARCFAESPAHVLAFLGDALDPVASLRDVPALVRALAGRRGSLQFLFEFVARALPAAWNDPARAEPLREFLLRKYRVVIAAVARSREDAGWPQGLLDPAIRAGVRPILDAMGARLWQQFVTNMPFGGNDRLLEEDRGVVQRDLVRALAPFLVAWHNGDAVDLSLAPGGTLRGLVVRMLNHRVTSIVGYVAACAVPIAARGRWEVVEALLDELAHEPTDSGRFYAHLLLAHVAYLDPAASPRALETLGRRILPWFAADRFDWEWPTLFTLCITAVDISGLWPACREILGRIFADLTARGDPAAAAALGEHLLKASFLGDGALGRRVLGLLLEDGFLRDPVWRDAVLKVAGGLGARSPALLLQTLEEFGADPSVAREARRHVGDSVIEQRDLFAGQVTWDRMIMTALGTNARLRYLLLRDLVGGIAQARGPDDFGIAVRRCLVDGVVAIFGDEPDARYARLSVADVLG